jgi:hypothetical protein
MHGWTVKALGLLFFQQALCLSDRTSNALPTETARFPVVRSTALFAHFLSWSDDVWNLASASVRFWRPLAITPLGKPEIIAIRGSGIFLL